MPNSWSARIAPWAPVVEATAVTLTLLFTAVYAVPQLRNASTQLRQTQTALEDNVRTSLRQQQLEIDKLRGPRVTRLIARVWLALFPGVSTMTVESRPWSREWWNSTSA
jgi:hypothetical protein